MLTKDGVIETKRKLGKIEEFFYSDLYILSVAILTLFFWTAKLQEVGFLSFVLIASFQFVIMRDMTPVIPMLLAIFFMPSDVGAFSSPWEYIIFLPAAVCLVIHFVRFPVEKFKFGRLFFPLLSVLVTLLLGGVFSEEIAGYLYGIVQIAGIGVGMLFAYTVLSQYICPPKTVDLRRFLFFMILVVCLIPSVEMLSITVLKLHSPNGVLSYQTLGWGDKNFVGYILLVGIPACFYFIAKSKYIVPWFLVLAVYIVSTFYSACDGAIGVLAFVLPLLTVLTYYQLPPRKRILYCALILAFGLIIITDLLVFVLSNENYFAILKRRFLNDTGRTPIYRVAWERFLKYPLFGNGAYYPNLPDAITPINYHSIIFHTLATTGIFGFLAYAFLIGSRFKVLTAKSNVFNFYAFFSVLSFELYCFVDCGEFLMIVIFINMITLITERINRLSDDRPPLLLRKYY